jgi:hypothetical protein
VVRCLPVVVHAEMQGAQGGLPEDRARLHVTGLVQGQNRYFKPSSTPLPGDLVVFSYCHIGMVVKVTSSQIVTIEGNQADAVRKVVHSRRESTIDGYCRPAYHMVEVDDVTKEELIEVLRSGFTPGEHHHRRPVGRAAQRGQARRGRDQP